MLPLFLLLLWAGQSSFETLFRSGLAALQQNQLATAQAQLEAAAKLKPDSPEVWLALAHTYHKLDKAGAAESAIGKAASLAGNDPAALKGLALYHSEAGNYEQAAEFSARFARLTPEDASAAARAAELYLKARRPEPAINLVNRALQIEDRADLRALLAAAYEIDQRPNDAAEQMEHAIRLNRYEEDYYFRAARDYLIAGKAPMAVRVVEAGKKIFARSAQLELILGIAYYALERYSDALDTFLNAIRMDPTVEQPYIFIARTMDHTPSRLPRILAAFKSAADNDPENYRSNYLYGKALLMSGDDDDKAEALLRKSISLKADYWESHLELAKALEQKGDLESAVPELRRAIELNPKSSEAHFRLGRVYDRVGKPEEAKKEYAIQTQLIDAEESGPRHSGRLKQGEGMPAKP
jgi:tetratricopeptide (TPR) repeat protein